MASRDNSNSQGDKRDRIERLRKRLDDIQRAGGDGRNPLVGVLRGILDLLADEL